MSLGLSDVAHADQPHQYSDSVVHSSRLNAAFISMNNCFAFLYRNIINAPLMSKKTIEIRRKIMSGNGRRDNEGEHDTEHKIRVHNSKFTGIPGRNNAIFFLFYFVQLTMSARNLFLFIYLSDYYPKRAFVSYTQPTTSMRFESTKCSAPIRLVASNGSAGAVSPNRYAAVAAAAAAAANFLPLQVDSSAGGQLDCTTLMEDLYTQKYGNFYIWRASADLIDLQDYDQVHVYWLKYFLLEQHLAIQMLRKEAGIYNYLTGCVVATCGIFGCWLISCYPYDVTALMLVYEPVFVARHIEFRVSRYLRAIRHSYDNFWHEFSIDPSGHLAYQHFSSRKRHGTDDDRWSLAEHNESESGSGRESHDYSTEDVETSDEEEQEEELCARRLGRHAAPPVSLLERSAIRERDNLSYATLRSLADYIPPARGQAWRRLLIIGHPLAQLACQLILGFVIISMWGVVLTTLNLEPNAQLKSLLAHERPAGELVGVSGSAQVSSCLGQADDYFLETSGHLARQSILNNCGACLRNANCKTTPLRAVGNDSACTETQTTPYEPATVLELLGPTELPPLGQFIAPWFGVAITVAVVYMHVLPMTITMADLCYWLIAIRVKLNVCGDLLKHIHERATSHRASGAPPPAVAGAPCLAFSKYDTDYYRRLDYLHQRTSSTNSAAPGDERQRQTAGRGDRDELESVARGTIAPKWAPGPYLGHKAARGAPPGRSVNHLSVVCNIDVELLLEFLLANRSQKERICERYARTIISLDKKEARGSSRYPGRITDEFLMSTYLDFRLFLDQIDDCRQSMNIIIGFVIFHAFNMIGASLTLDYLPIKLAIFGGGMVLANFGLAGSAFFQSQCSKLHAPIHTALALCTRGDRMTRHLALLWRRSLLDFTGSRSKFSFGFYSIEISYATMLQFNLSVVSVCILLLDKSRFGA